MNVRLGRRVILLVHICISDAVYFAYVYVGEVMTLTRDFILS